MPTLKVAPYGSWKSPITPDSIVSEMIRLGQIVLDSQDLYWVEMRPSEGGRNVIVHRAADGTLTDITPKPFNVRSQVHEYGGAAFTVRDGTIYFSNFKDGRIYVQKPDSEPSPLTKEDEFRYADLLVDTHHNALFAVREDHSKAGEEPTNTLVAIDVKSGEQTVLASGNDFYASPALSSDGSKIAWLTWNHPNMPWDGTELWMAELEQNGRIVSSSKIAGAKNESVFQPQWSPDGILYFVSDRSGWWNLYRFQDDEIEHVIHKQAEFGLPQWIFGMSTYAFESSQKIVCTYFENGIWYVGIIDLRTDEIEPIDLPFTYVEGVRASQGQAAFIAGSPILANSVVRLEIQDNEFEIIRKSTETPVESTFFSRPEEIDFPTDDGLTAHAYYYPPQNRDFEGPSGERPPLIVKSHGGPTASADATLDLRIQFWTSRGFALLDVNYGGSTGYGREYRNRLDGKWGIVDVNDCINAAKYLVAKGVADPDRTAIAGGSAGGYTTLSALTFGDFFKAGASYYGISDLEALAKDTHKFESRYLDRLIGPYPEQKEVYENRSPIHFTEKLSCPVIIMQGLEDKVVPPDQAEKMVEALRKKGLPVAYVTFEGEQHGFRKAESIKRSLEAELYFYSQIFGFELADKIAPVEIENL